MNTTGFQPCRQALTFRLAASHPVITRSNMQFPGQYSLAREDGTANLTNTKLWNKLSPTTAVAGYSYLHYQCSVHQRSDRLYGGLAFKPAAKASIDTTLENPNAFAKPCKYAKMLTSHLNASAVCISCSSTEVSGICDCSPGLCRIEATLFGRGS